MKFFFLSILFISYLTSCQKQDPQLEFALNNSGSNRGELEKVLQHYSKNSPDSLKLQAAIFLIKNMPEHYTLDGGLINMYRKKIDADTSNSYLAKKTFDISVSHYIKTSNALKCKEDLQYIKADFLIRHIDATFELLQKCSWLENLPWDVFLEYVLPYRFENENLDLWRDSLQISPDSLKEIARKEDIKYSIREVSKSLEFEKPQSRLYQDSIITFLKTILELDCYYLSQKMVFKKRALGLPVALDYVPCYPNRGGYHYWVALITPAAKNTDVFNGLNRKAAKIYRRTFSRNDVIIPQEDEYVPGLFLDPFNKDVTNVYLNTRDVVMKTEHPTRENPNHAYLAVFNNLAWRPISASKLKKKAAKFKDMGREIVYLPVYYDGYEMLPLDYPFILNLKGEIKKLIPDTCSKQSLHLTRKYPSDAELYSFYKRLKNLCVEADNHLTFSQADTILTFEPSSQFLTSQETGTRKAYRYWRIANHQELLYIAELIFTSANGEVLTGKVAPRYQKAFDNSPLTNVIIDEHESLIIDFGQPVQVAKIVCLPRSDGNGIYPGNEYELLYHTLGGWRSLGEKIATDYSIDFDNVPTGALYWLRNHTTGSEERIFTYEKGSVRFW